MTATPTAPVGEAAALLANGDLRLRPCRYGLMLYSLNDDYIGGSLEIYGEYMEEEVAVYRALVGPGQVVVDAGANIGTHSVFFARAVSPGGALLAIEPQRVVHQMLCANLAVNGLRNAEAIRAGVGAVQGTARVPPQDYGQRDNFGAVPLTPVDPGSQPGTEPGGETVPVVPLDALKLARCDFLKVDVEGMERAVLLGGRETIGRCRPTIYLENNVREKSPDLISTLLELGYRLFWHLPRLFNGANFRGCRDNHFAGTINANMLCLPPGDNRQVAWLKQVSGPDDWWGDAPQGPEASKFKITAH